VARRKYGGSGKKPRGDAKASPLGFCLELTYFFFLGLFLAAFFFAGIFYSPFDDLIEICNEYFVAMSDV
jgi:hypothetical protein